MNKKILEAYVKVAVKKQLKEQEKLEKNAEKAIYLIHRFPKLKELMEDLMSPAFGRFIASIRIIAPKPTVFNIELINGQEFDITYLGSGKFRLRVLGKKYYPINIGELERASQSIADLLLLSKPSPDLEQAKQKEYNDRLANDLSGGGGSFSGGTFPNDPGMGGDAGAEMPQNDTPLDGNSEIPANTPEEDEDLLNKSREENPQ